ncbi:anaerobic sulfatase maturase [Streptomyces collinus]|uniref:anaerobic sulfatase maturase n=1 Tax=Streptomyces collinus TaxID=42684 RepID=UPI00340A8CA9
MSTVDLPAPTVRRHPFHLLAKPAGAICNLDCTYCFFLSKELLYEGSRFRMADELLDAYIRQLIEAHGPVPEVTVAWQGGEPTLMGLDFFRRSLEYERRYARPGQRIVNTIQTNGTLIDAEWARFFRDNDFLVGLSVDGPRELHDAYRVDKGGKPTFDRVMRGLGHLRTHGVQWNALTTLHDANAGRGRSVYAFLRDDCGATHMQFIPIVERTTPHDLPLANDGWGARAKDRPVYRQEGDKVTDRSVTGQQYGRFLIDVFEDWVRHDVGRVYVQMFDVALANWYGEQPSLCVHSRTCGSALALEHNGDLYSCDHFVEPDHLLGNIGDRHMLELVDSPQQRKFGQDKYDTLPRYCHDCDVRFACHGGCPKDRFDATPDGEPGLNHLCAGFKAFFHHVDRPMRTMAGLLRQGRAPALIMREYASADANRPHNALCPCEGGRKWARCHGKPVPTSQL